MLVVTTPLAAAAERDAATVAFLEQARARVASTTRRSAPASIRRRRRPPPTTPRDDDTPRRGPAWLMSGGWAAAGGGGGLDEALTALTSKTLVEAARVAARAHVRRAGYPRAPRRRSHPRPVAFAGAASHADLEAAAAAIDARAEELAVSGVGDACLGGAGGASPVPLALAAAPHVARASPSRPRLRLGGGEGA